MSDWSRFFGPRGALARAHPAYEPRPGQAEMARTVASVLDEGGCVLIEAGTGIGKTLAYLIPAIDAGRRVVVSTGTRNLQDQIFLKDVPFLRRDLGLEVSACVMKGRDNYLCRYRFAQFQQEPLLEEPAEARWVGRITEWSRKTTTGDRSEIADLPDQLRLWRDLNARADTCAGSRCPEYDNCWLTRLKRRAQSAQIVVVNHHLFFADLAVRTAYGAVLPDYDTAIFDEGHLLEEIATLYFGVRVSSAQIDELGRRAESLAASAGGPARGGGGSAELREAGEAFFHALRQHLPTEAVRQRFEPEERGGPRLDGEWDELEAALGEVARLAPTETEESVESLPQQVAGLQEAFGRVLDRGDPAFVYGCERRGRGYVVLSASPIDVSDLLRERLFDGLHAAVLTSATLAVEGRFNFFTERLGLTDAAGVVVESPFDHDGQAMLYLPEGMPEPNRPEFLGRAVEQILALLEASSGRAFLLFTSYANLHAVHSALREEAGYELFVQGEGSRVALVDGFVGAERGVLLGTSSFWHGVDVPGEALSLVVVDRLPFDVPSDPLVAARIEKIRADGGNPFTEYQVPLAVLQLKQGLGRLLRRKTDRGVVAVLDPRLTTRRYGRTFLRSLPPYRQARSLEAVRAFFRNQAGQTPVRDPIGSESITRVGLISDTHGLVRREALQALRGVDRILHAGDVGRPEVLDALRAVAPVRAVRGNVDRGAWAEALPPSLEEEIGGVWFHVLHVRDDLDLDPRAAGFDIVVFGHSHRPTVEQKHDVVYVNPGSAGPRRFRLPVSLALVEIEHGRPTIRRVDLVTGGTE